MATTPQDRLIRKEVALGAVRERQPPKDHIGLQIAPFLEVESDDVIFEYIKDSGTDQLAPARAEDAESRLTQRDEFLSGVGRASLIDWSFKDKYSASDVTRYRDNLAIAAQITNTNLMLNPVGSAIAQFQARLARDDASRKRSLDNRIEWLIMTGLDTGKITYNDGKLIFSVDFNRPSDQNAQAVDVFWDAGVDHNPIADIKEAQQVCWDRYQIKLDRGIISKKGLDAIWKSKFFLPLLVPVVGGTPSASLDPNYLTPGWTEDQAVAVVERATGVRFTVYDSVYVTRASGSNTRVNNRYTNEKMLTLLPSSETLGEIDDTEIGFAKTLTSPHAEGNWTAGFYEWEQNTVDPWMHVRGNGIKAFPVFPYMKFTFQLKVLA